MGMPLTGWMVEPMGGLGGCCLWCPMLMEQFGAAQATWQRNVGSLSVGLTVCSERPPGFIYHPDKGWLEAMRVCEAGGGPLLCKTDVTLSLSLVKAWLVLLSLAEFYSL